MATAALLRKEALHTASRNSEKEQLDLKDESRQKALIRLIRRKCRLAACSSG